MLNLLLRCEPNDQLWRDALVDPDKPCIPDFAQLIRDCSRVRQANRHGSHFAEPERMSRWLILR
jgi:hypothetical protein